MVTDFWTGTIFIYLDFSSMSFGDNIIFSTKSLDKDHIDITLNTEC